jgi:hypothetical protein
MSILQAESATVICQRALALAEARNRFTSLEDGSDEAREARLRYDIARRTVLEAIDWRFARRRLPGVAVVADATPYGFPKAWATPPDCIRIRGVWDGPCLLRHVREEVVFTEDLPAVQIVFTADRFNPALFPPVFTRAVQFALAAEFAMIYARSINRADAMAEELRRTMIEAERIEAAERTEDPAYADGPWLDALRGTGWL